MFSASSNNLMDQTQLVLWALYAKWVFGEVFIMWELVVNVIQNGNRSEFCQTNHDVLMSAYRASESWSRSVLLLIQFKAATVSEKGGY